MVNAASCFILHYFAPGVLQGCPASAFLFNLALDPFLILFEETLRNRTAGIIHACADDIGIALAHLKYLVYLAPIFEKASPFAGLSLKPPKCVLVPLVHLTDRISRQISTWLATNLPIWGNFLIKGASKYLGFFLGPQAGSHQWVAPFRKYIDRVEQI